MSSIGKFVAMVGCVAVKEAPFTAVFLDRAACRAVVKDLGGVPAATKYATKFSASSLVISAEIMAVESAVATAKLSTVELTTSNATAPSTARLCVVGAGDWI